MEISLFVRHKISCLRDIRRTQHAWSCFDPFFIICATCSLSMFWQSQPSIILGLEEEATVVRFQHPCLEASHLLDLPLQTSVNPYHVPLFEITKQEKKGYLILLFTVWRFFYQGVQYWVPVCQGGVLFGVRWFCGDGSKEFGNGDNVVGVELRGIAW